MLYSDRITQEIYDSKYDTVNKRREGMTLIQFVTAIWYYNET